MWDAITMWEVPDFVILLIAVFVAIWEIIRWRGSNKIAKEIEGLKVEYAKKLTIHSIAFETEFNVYREIWKAVRQLRQLSVTVTPTLQIGIPDYKDDLVKANEAWLKAYSVVEGNKPFYSPKIYDLCDKMNRDCMAHLVVVHDELAEGSFKESFDSNKALIEKANPIIKDIEQAIRDEIESLDRAELIG